MAILRPAIVVLDSATIGRLARDYWHDESRRRVRAVSFLSRLEDTGAYVAFMATHLMETLRHANGQVAEERLRFLRSIPFAAKLRPYDESVFPGSICDLHLRELHAVVNDSAQEWGAIIDRARRGLWEMGRGSEILYGGDAFWDEFTAGSKHQFDREKYNESIVRTDPAGMADLTIADIRTLPERPMEDRAAYVQWFSEEMQRQLDRHGDKRLGDCHGIAGQFSREILAIMQDADVGGESVVDKILEEAGVPRACIRPDMRLSEVGELAVYASRLAMMCEYLRPPARLGVRDVPPEILPSYVLERKLASIQRREKRISASDFGDRHIAPLVFYADCVQVDKRTHEFLNQIRRREPELASLMGRYIVTSADYHEVLPFLAS